MRSRAARRRARTRDASRRRALGDRVEEGASAGRSGELGRCPGRRARDRLGRQQDPLARRPDLRHALRPPPLSRKEQGEPDVTGRRCIGVRWLLAFVFVLTACGGGLVATSPTPAVALSVAELKYRVMDTGGRIEFCDPDFYPIARDTRIATPSGDVAVQNLRIGDLVWTLDGGVRTVAPVIALGNTPVPTTHQIVRVVLSDGRVVRASPGHPTADGRVVGELRRG